MPGDHGEFGAVSVTLSFLGLLGGALWCIGNLCTVEIISSIGLGLGMALWGGTSLCVAFIIGRVEVCLGGECHVPSPLSNIMLGVLGCASSASRHPPPG